MPTIGSVTITWDPVAEEISLDPELGTVNRNIQVMQWSLVVPTGSSAKFGPTGITFEPSPPAPNSWPEGTVLERENDWQYRAEVNFQVGEGPAQTYGYLIDIDPGTGSAVRFFSSRHKGRVLASEGMVSRVLVFDPEIQNEPQP